METLFSISNFISAHVPPIREAFETHRSCLPITEKNFFCVRDPYNSWRTRTRSTWSVAMKGVLVGYALGTFTSSAHDIGTDQSILSLSEPVEATSSTSPPLQSWHVTNRDQHTTTREFYETVSNSGYESVKTHRIIEVRSGLNYFEESLSGGQWKESRDEIEPCEEGAAAVHGPHKVFFPSNLKQGIQMVLRSRRSVHVRPIGLYYFDPMDGRSVKISGVTDSAGEIQPPNQVIWKSALDSIQADIRMIYDRSGLECDLIFLEMPPPPSQFGLGENARIELWHEFEGMAIPSRKSRVLKKAASAVARARMLEPDLVDETLDFGPDELWFPSGRAFRSDAQRARGGDEPALIRLIPESNDGSELRIAKSWRVLPGNRTVLVESLEWADLKAFGHDLPQCNMTVINTVATYRELPSSDYDVTSSVARRIEVAKAPYSPRGIVWDFITVASSGTDMEFLSEASAPGTYLISGSTYFSGLVTFNSGCILKYENGAYLLTSGDLQCNGVLNPPGIFTAKADPRWGEQIPGGCPPTSPQYAASIAIWDYYIGRSLGFAGMRICYANTAIQMDAPGDAPPSHAILNTTFEACKFGFVGGPVYSVQNSTAIDVQYPGWGCTTKTSLRRHVIAQTQPLANGHTAPLDLLMYADTGSPNYFVTNYNQDCWFYGKYGYTSLSMSNWPVNYVGIHAWWQGAGTLITPRVAVSALHMTPGVGSEYRFVGDDGYHHVRTSIAVRSVELMPGQPIDWALILFDTPLPASVHHVKLVPVGVFAKAPYLQSINYPNVDCPANLMPCVTAHGNLPKSTFAYDWRGTVIQFTYPGTRALFSNDIWLPGSWGSSWYGGDCGQPAWALINDELVLVGTVYHPAAAQWWGYDISTVNAAIASAYQQAGVPPPYDQAVPVDLSSFPDLN